MLQGPNQLWQYDCSVRENHAFPANFRDLRVLHMGRQTAAPRCSGGGMGELAKVVRVCRGWMGCWTQWLGIGMPRPAIVLCPEDLWLAMPQSFQERFCYEGKWAEVRSWSHGSANWAPGTSVRVWSDALSWVLCGFLPLLWSVILNKTGLYWACTWGQKYASAAKPGSGSVIPQSSHLWW